MVALKASRLGEGFGGLITHPTRLTKASCPHSTRLPHQMIPWQLVA
jgi:hypothetical protein